MAGPKLSPGPYTAFWDSWSEQREQGCPLVMRTHKYFLIFKKWESARTRWRAWLHPSQEKSHQYSAIFVLCNGVAWWKVEERVPFEMPIHQVVFGGFVRDCKFFRVKRNEWLCNEVDCILNHRRDLVSRDQGRLSCHSPTICSQNP